MANVCCICNESLENGATVTVERGLDKLREASVDREDGKVDVFRSVNSIKIHIECRRNYTRKSSIVAFKRKREAENAASTSKISPPKAKMRSNQPAFEFKKYCFICGSDADEQLEKKKPKERRQIIRQVSTLGFRDTILNLVEQRKDEMAKEIKKRIIFEIDLVAAEAKYHDNCLVKLSASTTDHEVGRPLDANVITAMERIFFYIENNNDCQFTLTELKGALTDFIPDDKTIKKKLGERYGDKIVITTKHTGQCIICLRETSYDILNKAWYEARKENKSDERYRILEAAASILRQDIHTQVCETDYYPSSSTMFNNINDSIPKPLLFFLEEIILKVKKGKLEPLKKICTAISHFIMSAVRPRSFTSPLQLGISVYLHRQFSSKRLLDILSCLGVCASYNDILLYEAPSVFQPPLSIAPPEQGCFVQYVCDNADFNVATINGLNTFHSMGIIQIITPHNKVQEGELLPKFTTMPSAKDIARVSQVRIETYENHGAQGLKKIIVENLDCDEVTTMSMLRNTDVLWMYGKWKNLPDVPGWSGFMERLTKDEPYTKSRIHYLPFINQPASNYNTLYTSLKCILDNAKINDHKTCVVTFDQPLYFKAREIVATLAEEPEFSKIIVRLGGFHMLMSFLGSIGFVMSGSGLKEAICTIYAPNSVDKMLLGHAYSRAIRAHTLLQVALSQIIFNEITFDDTENEFLNLSIENIRQSLSFKEVEESNDFRRLKEKFEQKLKEVETRGPTAKLWIQYFEMITIAKEFIRAERMGDWEAHLTSVKKMIPYFHATGHFLYAKSTHLYVQDTQKLETVMDSEVFNKFTNNFFAIKRTDKFFCGTWSDMVIEQTLMKSSKSREGFTHGRSTKESVLSKWILGLVTASNISEGLENFCDLSFSSGEQHVDARDSRVAKDNIDVQKLSEWFQSHNPFPQIQKIMSIATGLTGDQKINCYKAQDIGTAAMEKVIGTNFNDIKFTRANRVLPLSTINGKIKVHNTTVPVDPLLLFQRISAMRRSTEEIREYFQYELAPYPISLFDESGMRKTKKSSLFDSFEPLTSQPDFDDVTYVIDGGFLLHRVVWHQNDTFNSICTTYINYVQKHFGPNTTIVFDGYSNSSRSVKSMEQFRRSSKLSSVEIMFDGTMNATVSQDNFLANNNNKTRLISMLTTEFGVHNIPVKQSEDDADVLIIETALEESLKNRTVIVGEDVDLMVLLIARTPVDKEIYFMKPGKGKVERRIYSSRSFDHSVCSEYHLLFLHAVSGCDTTSALFSKGKTTALELLEKRQDLRAVAQVFTQSNASHDLISSNGNKFLMGLYGAPIREISLDEYRYLCFTKLITKNKPVKLHSLPPTDSAAKEHLYRVYFQIQKWLGNELNPEEWGWILKNDVLEPKKTSRPPAPDHLLNMIFCNCSKGCGPLCSCRKLGIRCSSVCGHCCGQSCLNANTIEDIVEKTVGEAENDNQLETLSTYFLEQRDMEGEDEEDEEA